ncbi:ExbD/TolR family protein [Chromobacterium sphagni]|uniref:Biopolymer transporter ExbD n=1 Tax=Chromobacterium sphagni TaxID=1903179 RepID=A0A1S1X5L3_9NEIS|nr:biopolymer transporter ExbD [Chromobacterium sphagni]OHX14716.1 biopolymer transporter ExbD [Chromobacterium sphagni]OHX14727.1 biopolymer transporter ExbD [Chromobacterium sphagni]OHX20747.1 biopolymer transporter ExbD [Chromobacterium sphagni]OHX20757.1 biopolymer transporter ExbD [Chromobacterium sphagni]
MARYKRFGHGRAEEDQVLSAINTTPLVDVMLVLLIIFLITVPVVTQTVKMTLPKEQNIPTQTKPENIVLGVDTHNTIYWNTLPMKSQEELLARLVKEAKKTPQPEVHIRGDAEAKYAPIGRIVLAVQQAGIVKIAFITEPPARN